MKKKWISVIAAAGLLAALVLLFVFWNRNRVYHTAAPVETKVQNVGAGVDSVRFEEGILRYSREGISFLNSNDKETWNKSTSLADPMLLIRGSCGALGDKLGRHALIFDEEGVTGEIETIPPITNMALSSKGVLALALDEDETTRIVFYDKKGKKLDIEVSLEMSISGYPLDMELSADGNGLVIAAVSSASGKLRSQLVFYNFSVGKGEANRLIGFYDYEDCLFPQVSYISEKEVVAVGTDRIVYFDLSNETKPTVTAEIPVNGNIRNAAAEYGKLAVIVAEEAGGMDLTVYDSTGKALFTNPVTEICRRLSISDCYAAVRTDAGLQLFDFGGRVRFNGALSGTGTAVFPEGHRTLWQLDGSTIYRYRLR